MACQKKSLTVSASLLILDIEGTTTSISFVKDVLFPYIRQHLEEYVEQFWGSGDCHRVVQALRAQAKEDKENKVEGVVPIPNTEDENVLKNAVKENVFWQMDLDRKTKSLKDLQGLVMEDGYKRGELRGHVYEDVEPCLKAWNEQDKSVVIYSSGSVYAQKLLFGYSEKGDLLPLIQGHFDTTVGIKGEPQSYKNILRELSCRASQAVFLTDIPKEARAAKEAGVAAVLLSREGNAPLSDIDVSEFPVICSFEEIQFDQSKITNIDHVVKDKKCINKM